MQKQKNEKWVVTEIPPKAESTFVATKYVDGIKTDFTFHSPDLVYLREVLSGDLDLKMSKSKSEDKIEVWE